MLHIKKSRHCLQCGALLPTGEPSDWHSEACAQAWDKDQRKQNPEAYKEETDECPTAEEK